MAVLISGFGTNNEASGLIARYRHHDYVAEEEMIVDHEVEEHMDEIEDKMIEEEEQTWLHANNPDLGTGVRYL